MQWRCRQSQLMRPLRLPIQDEQHQRNRDCSGREGRDRSLERGKTVVFNPSQKSAEVKDIEMHHTSHAKAEPGDNVGFNVRGLRQRYPQRRRRRILDSEPMFVRHDETFVGQIHLWIYKAIGSGYTQCSTLTPLR